MTNGMNLWGRNFSLPVYYECDSDQGVLDIQKEAKGACLQAGIPLRTARKRSKIIVSKETAIRSRAPLQTSLDTLFRPVSWYFGAMMLAKQRSCATIALTPNTDLLRYLKTKNLRLLSPKTSSRPATSTRITKTEVAPIQRRGDLSFVIRMPAAYPPPKKLRWNSSCLGLQRP